VAVIAASLAGVTALLLGAAAVSLRTNAGERAEGSLVSTGALAPRDRIIVGEFADRAGDPSLAAAVTEAFRVDLAQSPLVRVLTPNEVRAALARTERPPGTVLDDTLAHELAVREGAKAFVMGSVARVGRAYTVSVQLINAQTGDPLAAHRETAADSSRLIGAVDRASKALRLRMGESLRDLRDMPSLEQVTTASLPALRKYTEGYRIFLAGGDRVQALRLYEEAVALDTGFASAHGAIASTYESLAEPGRAAAAYRHVLANAHRLPFRDRQFVLGGHAYGSGDYAKAVEVYDRVLARFPNLVPALNNQALAYVGWRRFAVAESLWQRAIRGDSSIAVLYYGLHSAQAYQGKFAESRRTLDLISRRFPSDPMLMTVEVQDASARQAWDEAERRARTNTAAWQGDTLQLVDAFEALGGIVMTQGRLAEAERHWRSQLTMSAASESWGRHFFGVQQLAYLELRYRNAADKARATVDSALTRRPLDNILPGDRPYRDLARFYARAGDIARARALSAAADSNDRTLGHERAADRSWTAGVLALAEGRTREAEAELRKAADTHACPICPLPDLARAYEAANKPADAAATYDRYATTPWLWRYETDAVELGWALLRLGELYEQRSSPELAAATYSKLLHLWRRADRELEPVLLDVRRRLDMLDRAAPPR
jgi:tetratricopeptide (TPR) repeat protein